jgi:nitrate reductase gamma subunit
MGNFRFFPVSNFSLYCDSIVFLLGSILRFDRDPYSWRSKSSQLLRRKQLIIGSILFHLGILVILGRARRRFTYTNSGIDALGISHGANRFWRLPLGELPGFSVLLVF